VRAPRSQGAAVAAALAALVSGRASAAAGSGGEVAAEAAAAPAVRFRFVLCCGGFVGAAPELGALYERSAPIAMPSLHVVGEGDGVAPGGGGEELVRLFCPARAEVVRHGGGHFMPAGKRFVERYVEFLDAQRE